MDDHLAFLATDVARLIRKQLDARARHLGVTGPQCRVLLCIARTPGLNQGAIAERLEVEPITTCRMIDRLEQAGLVRRERDPGDRRAWKLFLTDAASPMIHEMRKIGDDLIDTALDGMSVTDKIMVRRMFETMRSNLSDGLSGSPILLSEMEAANG